MADLVKDLLEIPACYKKPGADPARSMISRIIQQNVESKKLPVSSWEWAQILQTLINDGQKILKKPASVVNASPEPKILKKPSAAALPSEQSPEKSSMKSPQKIKKSERGKIISSVDHPDGWKTQVIETQKGRQYKKYLSPNGSYYFSIPAPTKAGFKA